MTREPDRDERLLELALDPAAGRGAGRRRGPDAAVDEVELEELRDFLATCRAAFAEELEPAPANPGLPALVERVLARTTREDLSWRGDLRLVGAFLRERLRSSRALRIAAASLVLHLLALPTIGWYLLTAPGKEPTRILFLPAEPLAAGAAEAEEQLALDTPGESPGEDPGELSVPRAAGGPLAAEAFDVENALRRARFLLAHGDLPRVPPAQGAPAALEIRLLRARSAGVHERRWDDILDDSHAALAAGGLARVLFAEALLDRYALEGRAAELVPALLAGMGDGQRAADPALSALEAAAHERAARYGLVVGGSREASRDAVRTARADRPVDAAWLLELARALRAAGIDGPEVDAWLAWRAEPRDAR